MRALLYAVFLTVLATSSTGCALFGKKEGSGERAGGGFAWFKKKEPAATTPPSPKFPSSDPLMAPPGGAPSSGPSAQTSAPGEIALLAGRVVDSYNRPTNNTYVRLVNLEGPKDSGKAIDMATDPDGYFTIPNLKNGGQYQLIARTKQGEKMMAGITYTMAPNTRIVIQVKEEFATSSIPPLPAAVAAPPPDEKKDTKPAETSQIPIKSPSPTGWSPAAALGGPTGDLPTNLSVPVPVPSPGSNSVAPSVAGNADKTWPPRLQIGGPKPPSFAPTPPTPPQPPPLPAPADLRSGLAPLVPSCVLIADHLQTLALSDLDGQTWNFFKDRKGKLVLIDFWTANCLPCQKTMPVLTQLQSKFGPQGLEVVGISIDSGSIKDQTNRAKMLCYRLQTNYRQLLGQNDKTNICGQFAVQLFPSLILIDDTGRILWRHVGTPDQATLEQVIQKHLAKKVF
jgi:thiol-disulfide isomerase/thioredoxin